MLCLILITTQTHQHFASQIENFFCIRFNRLLLFYRYKI